MGNLIAVVIVDDDPLVRSGLALMLGGARDLRVVADAANGAEAVAACAEHHPDVVLMDLHMPVMDGIEATRQLCSPVASPSVLVLTTFDDDESVLRALAAGASGFLLKDTDPEDIVEAVRRVAAGEPTLSPTVTTTLIEQVNRLGRNLDRGRSAKELIARLTERERDVARAVGRGLDNTQIAATLHLSIPTVKAYVGRLFVKLDAENRVQIALLARDAELD